MGHIVYFKLMSPESCVKNVIIVSTALLILVSIFCLRKMNNFLFMLKPVKVLCTQYYKGEPIANISTVSGFNTYKGHNLY